MRLASSFLMSKFKTLLFLSIIALCALPCLSQTDTLHIYYQGLQTKTLDSNETKIATWAKTLKGKHVDVTVLAYYEKMDYKKYAQERADEMFLSLNRKARDIITIKSIGPKKGEKYQRSTLDIVYKTTGSEDKVKEVKEIVEKKEANNTNDIITKEEDKIQEKAVVEEKGNGKKSKKVETIDTANYKYDTIYINKVLTVKKTKIKKKK